VIGIGGVHGEDIENEVYTSIFKLIFIVVFIYSEREIDRWIDR
jgi:hypothetical protein